MENLIARVESITPALAKECLKHNKCNRQLRKNVVQYYAEQIKKKQWLLNGEAIIFSENGELADGQHRLSAIVESGLEVKMLVVRNADKNSFATIDSGVTRKISDTFFIKGIPNATNIAAILGRYVKLCKGNIAMGCTGNFKNASSLSRQDLLKLYASDEVFWQEISRFSAQCYNNMRLMIQTEIGALVAFLIKERNHTKSKVFEFFTELLISDTPKSGMLRAYRKRLIQDLTSTTRMNPIYKQQLFTKVWNNYIEGKETTCIRWIESLEGKKTLK